MMWLWFLDRGAALVGYAVLWYAMLTGILYNARSLGSLHRASRATHVPASVLATLVILVHAAVGAFDAYLVLDRQVPQPPYSYAYFAVGIGVGVAALLLLITSFLAFTDPRRFERPWDPRTVHLLAYGAFAFSTVHAIAIGTDLYEVVRPGVIAATVLLLYALGLRFFVNRAASRNAPVTKVPGPSAARAPEPRGEGPPVASAPIPAAETPLTSVKEPS